MAAGGQRARGDLAAFVAFQLGAGPASVLPRDRLDENFSRLIVANGNLTGGYGIGCETFRRGELLGFGHSGGVNGYEAAAYFRPELTHGRGDVEKRHRRRVRGTRLSVAILQTLNTP